MHGDDLLVKGGGASALSQHVQEAVLSTLNQMLNLALFDDLELGHGIGGLEQAEQVALGNRAPIHVELFAIGAAVVRALDGHLVGIDWNLSFLVVDGDLDPVGVRCLPVRALRQ